MALSEIEKLERRYAENPQGLTFAPLAEVHRKNGDVPRALELLKPGLGLHPDYIPASIVLGRCHLDLGELPAAEAAFTHVLSLDGENVIALKALADITERQYRFEESERWLRTLLAIDRSNDEARDQLSRVEASRRQAEVASSATPEAVAGQEGVADRQMESAAPATSESSGSADAPAGASEAGEGERPGSGMDDLVSAEPRAVSLTPGADGSGEVVGWVEDREGALASEAAPLELADLDLHVQPGSPEGIELDQPVSLAEPVEPITGLTGRDQEETGDPAGRASGGFHVELSEDIVLQSAGGSEFQMANASEELLSVPPPAGHSDPLMPDLPSISRNQPAADPHGAPPVPTEPAWATADSTTADAPPVDHAPDASDRDRSDGAGVADEADTDLGDAPTSPEWADHADKSLAATTSWPTIEAEGHVAEGAEDQDDESGTTPALDLAASHQAEGASVAGAPATSATVDSGRSQSSDRDQAATEGAAPSGAHSGTSTGSSDRDGTQDAPSEWRSPLPDVPPPAEPDLVVTESMADLLLQQGHVAEALTVYRHLAARGSSEKVLARIAELERTVGASPSAVPTPEPGPASPPRPAYSVQATGGQSAQAFLRGVLAGRLPAAPPTRVPPAAATSRASDAEPEGAPTRPAHDSLSLSSVFGDDATPTPPAVSTAVPASPGSGGVSYDEFYGAGGAASPARTARTPDPKSDDLDQFHAWLQNLKR